MKLEAKSWQLLRKGSNNEGSCIGQEDLRQVQGHHPPWGGQGDLRERKAQAAPGLDRTGTRGTLHESGQLKVNSRQLKGRIQAGLTDNCELLAVSSARG